MGKTGQEQERLWVKRFRLVIPKNNIVAPPFHLLQSLALKTKQVVMFSNYRELLDNELEIEDVFAVLEFVCSLLLKVTHNVLKLDFKLMK